MKKWNGNSGGDGGGAVYAFGLIGAAIYFLQNANTFITAFKKTTGFARG